MKELRIKQLHPTLGKIEGVMRIVGHIIYLKFNSNPYSEQVMLQMQSKGAIITKGKGWIRINIFGEHRVAKIENNELDLDTESPEQIETKLCAFFKKKYLESKFEVIEK